MKIIANNKKANYDYEFHFKLDAGLVLTGSEVKSLEIILLQLKSLIKMKKMRIMVM